MNIRIKIDTDNAAFEDAGAGREVARILRKTAARIEDWPGTNEFEFNLLDANGNKVGKAKSQSG